MNQSVARIAREPDPIENLVVNLQRLMFSKNINEAELARQTNIPQPTLHKILSGKTNDPRASTLKALADYFHISIDELLTGTAIKPINTIAQKTQSIPIISWTQCIHATDVLKGLTPTNWDQWVVTEQLSHHAFGLTSKCAMEPRFPRGTTLIIDPEITPEDGDMIVVLYPKTEEATMRELTIDGPTKFLLPICMNATPCAMTPDIKLLGVLVKSVFSFHS